MTFTEGYPQWQATALCAEKVTGRGNLKVRIDYGCHLSATPKATQTALSPVSYFPLQGRERLSRHYRQILVHHDDLKIEY